MDAVTNGNTAPAEEAKPKRVRTGCLTCRERHLKCDEQQPTCLNCKKSNRTCRRGLKLNFIDTKCPSTQSVNPGENKPHFVQPFTPDYRIKFQDESREIASEYKGGLAQYAAWKTDAPTQDSSFNFADPLNAPTMSHQPLPSIQPLLPSYDNSQGNYQDYPREAHHSHNHSTANSTFSDPPAPRRSPYNSETYTTPPNERLECLSSPEETLYMQVFVEEVGLWMDSMDAWKHFSEILPYRALNEPMLLNAFLACGARHLTLVSADYPDDKALHYYDTATSKLLSALQNPDRDTVICATTAVILNVYEIMSEKALQRMNHIAGARALIKECHWNATSGGIGTACFWLNVGMELLSCLHFNWQVAWHPDDWGMNMNEMPEDGIGVEEKWTHRMVYIVAKVANFRATIPRFPEATMQAQQITLQNRYNQWVQLKTMCEDWEGTKPMTMKPMARLWPFQTSSKSSFPEIWLVKRTTIVARLFYHTAMCLMFQINPMPISEQEMRQLALYHAQQICGIVVHVKDRGVASVSIRCLAIAAERLTDRREQEEVLGVFKKIKKETGWRVGFLDKELRDKWGWDESQSQTSMSSMPSQQGPPPPSATSSTSFFSQQQQQPAAAPAPPPAASRRPNIPSGILNPLLATADFSAPSHPYQSHYVAPNQHGYAQHSFF